MAKSEAVALVSTSVRDAKRARNDARKVKVAEDGSVEAPVEKKETLLDKLKARIFTTRNLVNFATFRFHFKQDEDSIHDSVKYLSKMFKEHEVKLYDFECRVQSIYNFSRMSGQRIAVIDGVPFFMNKKEEDIMMKGGLVVYVPIWMRERAKIILQRELLKHRGSKRISRVQRMGSSKAYSATLATSEQFIRDDMYNYIDRVFDRMVNNKQWYLDNGKRYKETFMLHGAPGTAKTSTYMHFGAKYELNILQATPETFVRNFESIINRARMDDRKPLMILIEDIDACDELLTPEYKSKLLYPKDADDDFNYSTFINALDGAEAMHNLIVCLSTNFKERLIHSVFRSGRIDHQLDVIPFTSEEIALRVNTGLSDYIKGKPDGTFSVANIIDLRFCKTMEEIDELVKWLHVDSEFKEAQRKRYSEE